MSSEPLEGLLTMFEFTFRHFAKHPELIRLLSAENLMEGEFLKVSETTPLVASPVIGHITTLLLLKKGEAAGAMSRWRRSPISTIPLNIRYHLPRRHHDEWLAGEPFRDGARYSLCLSDHAAAMMS
jgi:hypothetical protein